MPDFEKALAAEDAQVQPWEIAKANAKADVVVRGGMMRPKEDLAKRIAEHKRLGAKSKAAALLPPE